MRSLGEGRASSHKARWPAETIPHRGQTHLTEAVLSPNLRPGTTRPVERLPSLELIRGRRNIGLPISTTDGLEHAALPILWAVV